MYKTSARYFSQRNNTDHIKPQPHLINNIEAYELGDNIKDVLESFRRKYVGKWVEGKVTLYKTDWCIVESNAMSGFLHRTDCKKGVLPKLDSLTTVHIISIDLKKGKLAFKFSQLDDFRSFGSFSDDSNHHPLPSEQSKTPLTVTQQRKEVIENGHKSVRCGNIIRRKSSDSP